MNLLLDTHALLWWLDDSSLLPSSMRELIRDGRNLVLVSSAVVWECRIKQALGKLELPSYFQQVLDAQPFQALSITSMHAHEIASLPAYHSDPFDRMLVAQARVENLVIATRDRDFSKYDVTVVW